MGEISPNGIQISTEIRQAEAVGLISEKKMATNILSE